MARLLMVSTNLMDDPYPVYPLGANLVASAVKKHGHDVKLIDLMVDGESAVDEALSEFRPDYIAFSLRNVDNVNYNEPQSFISQYKSLIDRIKQNTDIPIILGGTAFTIFPEHFLQWLGADYGIAGPGEISLVKLVEQLAEGKKPVDPIIQGETDQSGANDYFLAREPRLAEFYLAKGGMLNIYTKRGCPYHCAYCSYPHLEGDRYIYREPGAVVEEIAYLISEHRGDFIFFADSVFNDGNRHYLLILEEMARRGISLPWTCYMRPDKFHRDEIELMKRTGLHSVEWGTDCSTDHTLQGMGKSFHWEDVKTANNLFADYGIPGSHFIIFGGPGETCDTVREGIQKLSELEYSVIFGGMGVRVFPHTGICDLAKQTGLIGDEHELFERVVYYHSPDIDIDWLNHFLLESFRGKRNWVFPWAGVAEGNRYMHNSGFRGPLWDLLLKRKNG